MGHPGDLGPVISVRKGDPYDSRSAHHGWAHLDHCPSIQYGGYFLLTSLVDRSSRYMDNALRQNFFRAGHAHAGVIVILSLICQVLADAANLPPVLLWLARVGVPAAAILISPRILLVDARLPTQLRRAEWYR